MSLSTSGDFVYSLPRYVVKWCDLMHRNALKDAASLAADAQQNWEAERAALEARCERLEALVRSETEEWLGLYHGTTTEDRVREEVEMRIAGTREAATEANIQQAKEPTP